MNFDPGPSGFIYWLSLAVCTVTAAIYNCLQYKEDREVVRIFGRAQPHGNRPVTVVSLVISFGVGFVPLINIVLAVMVVLGGVVAVLICLCAAVGERTQGRRIRKPIAEWK